MRNVFLLLGTNLGNRKENLGNARFLIKCKAGEIVKASSIYETAAWGIEDQPAFLNQVLEISTHLPAEELLQLILTIERKLGRVRYEKWKERLIDIDILFYGNEILSLENLKIPHPHLQERRFTLAPLVELAPDFVHPVLNKTMVELLEECPDRLEVVKAS